MDSSTLYITDLDAAKLEAENKLSEYYAQKEAEKSRSNEPDADGWMTVAPKRSSKSTAAPSAKSVGKPLTNFYSVQLKESKKQYLNDLRKKEIAARKKVEELRKTRTFRPF